MLLRFIIAMLMVGCLSQVEANAQLRQMRPFQRANRALGLYSGSGYHYQNPGPRSDYYNPYTAHNSGLVSRGYIPPNLMMNQLPQPMIGNSVVFPQNQQPLPPAPLGGSYESFDDDEENDQEELKSSDFEERKNSDFEERKSSDIEEKDGFDFDEENKTLEEQMKDDIGDDKAIWDDRQREPNNDFELPQDALDYSLHDN